MPVKQGRAEVLFDEDTFGEDLQRTTPAGRAAALAARDVYMQDGCRVDELLACDDEALDATRLPGCVKIYLPSQTGRFGMVFAIERKEGKLLLTYLAFGVRHHPRDSNAPTVYHLAHRRLHD